MTSETGSTETFSIPIEAAELYESAFVPGFFAQWSPTLCEMAGVTEGSSVLDVACGTGIAARTAADLAGSTGRVVGVDLNPSMLTVAARVRPDIEWRQGDAAVLPFDDASFGIVLCQMALMFLPDRTASIVEMARVAEHGGTIAVVVPSALDDQPAFKPFVELAARLTGPEAMSLLTTYFVCGDLSELERLFVSAGVSVTEARSVTGAYTAPSIDAAVTTEVESTPFGERISETAYRQLREQAHDLWRQYVTPDGRLVTPFQCNFVTARRP